MNKIKNVYLKSIYRDIKASFGRFISIVLIIFMGVMLFVGIKSVGPDLEATVNQFIKQNELSDVQIVSSAGLTKEDQKAAEEIKGVQAELGHSFPVTLKQQNIQLYSYSNNQANKLTLTAGHLPKKKDQVVLDEKLRNDYRMGDQFTIDNQQLRQQEFTVVGFVTSPIYVDERERGTTTIGDGELAGFMYLPETAFDDQNFSILYISSDRLKNIDYFSKKYENRLEKLDDQLTEVFTQQGIARQEQLQSVADQQALANGLEAGTMAIATPNYMINPRNSNPGFTEYTSLSDRIDAIANVFPVFFFFIAVLITFTTMTRMIEENRKEIGTLKSLGYRKREIASKYILYALLAALIGTVFGVVIGTLALPKIVFHLLSDQYIFTNYQYHFIFWPIVLAVIVALIATLGASLLTLMKELRENATTLLMPKAPKAGKRVFLERIKPIWRRMSFNQKVTYRNLFRYKARMILTIVGIAGCTGLMLAGFGLQDSISAPVEKQFVALTKYQGIVTLNGNVQTEAEKVLMENQLVTAQLPVYTDTVTFNITGYSKQTATLYVSDQPEKFSQYVALKDEKTKANISLSNQGALISQRLAKIYQVTKGDRLTFEDNDGKNYQIKVAGIVENYLGHNLYLSKEYYQEISGQTFTQNSYLIKTKKMTNSQEKKLAEDLLQTGEVLTTTYTSNQMAKQEAATENLGSIVLIFIVLSGTLAFVVLYNLTNINISERARELATIKVLGFFNQEVTMYIVRENIMFTLFGILFGFGIGNLLTRFILAMASSDMIVFPLVISWQGYVISAVMTVVFSVIVMGVTHFKLKQIDMIAALKSNE